MDPGSVVKLNDGSAMPRLGLGVFQIPPGPPTYRAVRHALDVGYRSVDTAAVYGNEADVGRAVKESGLPRGEIFVTTKLWNRDHGYRAARQALDASLERLGLDYVDLYLIHWPVEGLRGESWKALEEARAEGLCRSIGVSNYTVRHLEELLRTSSVVPAVNQVEFSPFLYQRELLDYCRGKGIQVEAYSPLTKGARLKHPVVMAIAQRHHRTPAQVLLRWGLQHGLVVIPRSQRPERILENGKVFDFGLDPGEMATLDGLGEVLRTSWDPTYVP